MPSQRRTAYDSYGQSLPELALVQQQSLLHSPHNQAVRRYLLDLLETHYQELFRRGVYAEVHIVLTVQDGSLGQKIVVQPRFEHLYQAEGR